MAALGDISREVVVPIIYYALQPTPPVPPPVPQVGQIFPYVTPAISP